jgi:hypothetical protein
MVLMRVSDELQRLENATKKRSAEWSLRNMRDSAYLVGCETLSSPPSSLPQPSKLRWGKQG